MNALSSPAPPASVVAPRARTGSLRATAAVLLAALAPMVTVPAIRRMLVDDRGLAPASVHLFVALGMLGSAIGAPLLARRADATRSPLRIATSLALLDAAVGLTTSLPVPSALLFALRPVHGLASMGLVALLFAEFRRSGRELVGLAGAAAIAALAFGPAIGGLLTKLGTEAPFRVAAMLSLVVAVLLAGGTAQERPRAATSRRVSFASAARPIVAPLLVAATQRFVIGGLVAIFSVQARALRGMSDAKLGAAFSTLLVVFAATTFVLGRSARLRDRRVVAVGGALFAGAVVALSFVPAGALGATLAVAGASGALAYAPCLAALGDAADDRARATSMALLHAAGAVGMVTGSVVAALVDVALRGAPLAVRGASFLALAGVVHAAAAVAFAVRRPQTPKHSPNTENQR